MLFFQIKSLCIYILGGGKKGNIQLSGVNKVGSFYQDNLYSI